jgi:hypothetical protein
VLPANNTWECASRVIKNEADFASNKGVATSVIYDIPGPGTYAVIFRPRMVAVDDADTRHV